jgi:polyhydroxyalkanoate synthesis regulator phasin
MAKRPRQQVPDAVRDAVERTIQATVGSAQMTRGRAQEAVDEIVRGAGASADSLRKSVRGAIEERRPASEGDVKAIRSELRAIARRLDAIEQRLPAKPASPARKTKPKAKPKPKT